METTQHLEAFAVMAHKYDLVTVPSQSSGTAKHFPWYKERLKWKYIQPRKQSNILRGTQWRFVRTDMDDFRTGILHGSDKNSIVYKLETGSVPVVDPVASQLRVSRRRTVSCKKQRPISETAMVTLNSKVGARMQEKLRRIAEAEESLLEHPLGLYPHLEEALPPELADYIFDVLEPEMRASDTMSDDEENVSDEAASIPSTVECEDQQDKQDEKIVVVDNQATLPTSQTQYLSKTGIYKWPLMDTPEEEAREQRLLAAQRAISPTQQYRVTTVTRDLVNWSKGMGGDGPLYIDEMTIKKLFANDEAKPTLTVPIHVMDHNSVPNELLMKSSHFSSRSQSHTVFNRHTENTPSEVVHHPSHIRTRYGAWYLHPKLWKPRPFNEPLRNPREEAKEKDQESRKKSEALDTALAETHGAKAFKDFIKIRPGIVMPKFLKNINFRSDYSKHQSRK